MRPIPHDLGIDAVATGARPAGRSLFGRWGWPSSVAQPKTLVTLQGLRFFAACLVLLSHVREEWLEMAVRRGVHPANPLIDGGFGVEIFFVISGFIMVHVSIDHFGKSGAPVRFMKDRLGRIVPLYWALTLAQSLYVIGTARHDAGEKGIFGVGPLVRSLLFIPYQNAQGHPRPILAQGWTLNFEMAFYVIFAACLALPRAAGLAVAIVALVALDLAGRYGLAPSPLALIADPIILYFACGILLACARRWLIARGALLHIPYPLAICAGIVLLFVLLDNMMPNPGWHWPCAVGVVAIAVLAADTRGSGRIGWAAVWLGNVSYSLYLAHGFVLELARIVWRRVFDWGHPGLYLTLMPVAGVIAGCLCYALIEKPLDRRFRRRRLTVPTPS